MLGKRKTIDKKKVRTCKWDTRKKMTKIVFIYYICTILNFYSWDHKKEIGNETKTLEVEMLN